VPTLAKVASDLAALSAAQAALKNHTGSRVDRDGAAKVVVSDMSQLHAYVESLANADSEQAETIAGDAAMTIAKRTPHHKPPLAVKQTVSASVKLIAKATPGAKANEWEYSTDGGKTWNYLPPTTQANTTVNDLVPGTVVAYRQRVLLKTGLSDWSQPISALVT
jgi:hypothetical protein